MWDLGQAQRTCLGVAGEPRLDARAMLRHLVPFRARRQNRARLHALRDLVDLLLGQLAPALEEARSHGRVPRGGLAVDARLTRNLPVALPRRPAAKHFLHIDHG